ncbi:PTS sugar transporter subunit IIA [Anaerostipes sp.]|uniref:PTS sugar transporter subunit IIA n=1 Tax=Anaerostipes sp. TaxID=1872530 RepID=UPI0025C3B5FE|nr:PTS sugar transporter subunit IIA [Anaerostipes sp.]MBS7009121.1 PTS sugar transporter subunit IIA [Anaerostipes sp.]
MVGLIVATHGDLSRALMRSVSLIAGEYRNIMTLCLERNDNADDFYEEIITGIKKVDEGDGVMIFTDILGGTPSNMSTLAARRHGLFCLTGVNLSMMIEFLMSAEDGLTPGELADRCFEAASSGIKITNKI